MYLCVGLLIGFFFLQQSTELPNLTWLLCGVICIGLILLKLGLTPYLASRFIRSLVLFALGVALAFSYGTYLAQQRLADQLSVEHEDKVTRLIVRIQELATYRENSIQFDVEVLESNTTKKGIPRHLRVYWSLSEGFSLYKSMPVDNMPEVRPGQVWEMALKLSRPNTLLNPGGFDNETYLFRENIRALASVKGNPILKEGARHTVGTYIQALRHDLRQRLQSYWGNKRYGAVLIALVMGDQQGIAKEDWELFNRSGMTHLVSISGSHITMLSGLVIWCSLWFLKRWRNSTLAARYDISAWAYTVGIGVALLYCLLAGWGIPAQRTFLMLLLAYIFYLTRRQLSLYQLFIITAVIVLLLDPWAILSTGFYLSFAAVAILQILLNRLRQQQQKPSSHHLIVWWQMLKEWVIVQGVITLAMAPFLMYFFHQLSFISPLVNAYAVPLVGLIITPIALVLALFIVLFEPTTVLQALAELPHYILLGVMKLTQSLVVLPWASIEMSAVPFWVRLLCGFGILLLLLPKGIPYRHLALLLCLPAFFPSSKTLQEGEWQAIFFDIGQAGAVLLKTQNHVLLFDTGVRRSPYDESGERVLLPALRALGIKAIHTLVVSHADIDHSGGLATLIQSLWVEKAYASFRMDDFLDREEMLLGKQIKSINTNLTYESCREGKEFIVDKVRFTFINQGNTTLPLKSSNHQSCVLSIEGAYHHLLLTGDILSTQEQQMLQSSAFSPPYHIVQVPHHGSRTSSSRDFIKDVQAQYAIAQTGYNNRFQHPHVQIKTRWQESGATFLNTAETGAIEVFSGPIRLSVKKRRELEHRYWYR